MQITGWGVQDWHNCHSKSAPDAHLTEALLTSLAGNAFSAWACMPFAIAVMSAWGRPDVGAPSADDDVDGDAVSIALSE